MAIALKFIRIYPLQNAKKKPTYLFSQFNALMAANKTTYIKYLIIFTGLFAALDAGTCHASDEIQVYTGDINAPGEAALELHANYVMKGRREPNYPGELAPHHVFNLTPEFSYGLTQTLELGLYLPMAYDVGRSQALSNGIKFRGKWLKTEENAPYYGINLELARNAKRVSEDKWTAEIRPIIGTESGNWSIAFNPILGVSLSGHDHRPEFEPALKINRKIANDFELGIEHYAGLGRLGNLAGAHAQSHATFLVSDFKAGGYEFNLGIGRGWRNSDEQWTIKLIIGGIDLIK